MAKSLKTNWIIVAGLLFLWPFRCIWLLRISGMDGRSEPPHWAVAELGLC